MEESALNADSVLAVTSGTSWISSLSSKVMLPSSTSHDASPIVTSEVTDLPHPDSPTTPIISPSFTERETECSASTGPSRVSKCTRRFWIFNRFDTPLPPVLGINYIPQSIAKKIESESSDENRHSWEEYQPFILREKGPSIRNQFTPLCSTGFCSQSDEG